MTDRYVVDNDVALLTTNEAAVLLGISSTNTIKNWLESGHFPGAHKTPEGHWRLPKVEVLWAKRRMKELHDRNLHGDLAPSDSEDDVEVPLL